jgi:FlgD Ig-like domain
VPRPRTGILVIAVLLAASGLAFLRAEQLKLTRSPVGGTRIQKFFSTTCPVRPHTRCTSHSAALHFRLRVAATVALSIRDGSGRTVRHLTPAAGRPFPRGPVNVRWDGRNDAGATVPQGRYHLRVDLISLHRVIDIPDPVELDNTPPTITVTSTPGSLPLRYRVSEPAVVYASARAAGGSAVFRGRGGHVRFRHTRLGTAPVRITLVAIDRAGNPSASVDAGSLRLPG